LASLVVSTGGMSIHVLKAANDALTQALGTKEADIAFVSNTLMIIAGSRPHDERVSVPLFLTLDTLFNASLLHPSVFGACVNALSSETTHYAKDIQKLLPLTTVLGTMCRCEVDAARTAAWALAMRMIASRYPKVRAKVGTELFTALLFLKTAVTSGTCAATIQCDLDAAMTFVTQSRWDCDDAPKVRGQRDTLCGILGVAKATAGTGDMAVQRNAASGRGVAESYNALVREVGY